MRKNLEVLKKQLREDAKKNGVNLTSCNELKKSPYKVAVAVRFTKNDETYKIFEFVADYNRFGATLSGCQAKFKENPLYLIGCHFQTVAISQKNDISFEFMCTILLNYICYYTEIEEGYKNLPNQSQGYIVDIDANDFKNTSIWCGTKHQLDELYKDADNHLAQN